MNKILILVLSLTVISCASVDRVYNGTEKIYLINESSMTIKSWSPRFDYEIAPNDTLVHEVSFELYENPSLEGYEVFASGFPKFYYDANTPVCASKMYDLESYENIKFNKTDTYNFESTYRFTDKKMQQGESCD